MKRLLLTALSAIVLQASAEDWPQLMFNAAHSGNAAERDIPGVTFPKRAVPLTDGIYTSPVVADGKVYVVDGSGYVACFDAATLKEVWHFQSKGGAQNCNVTASSEPRPPLAEPPPFIRRKKD